LAFGISAFLSESEAAECPVSAARNHAPRTMGFADNFPAWLRARLQTVVSPWLWCEHLLQNSQYARKCRGGKPSKSPYQTLTINSANLIKSYVA